jgi:O-methyltransferase involved in polyketide biosynthesis
MYLQPDEIHRLFDALRAFRAKRIRIIFSFMTRWPDGSTGFRPRSGLIESWLAWRNEPFTWAIEPESAQDFLATHGFRLVELALARQLTDEPPASALDGENLVLCESE